MHTLSLGNYPKHIPKVIHRNCGQYFIRLCIVILLVSLCTGCASQAPRALDNICHIFEEKPGWHKAAKRAEKKWGAPLQVPMAMMYQESKFKSDARPPRTYIFGVIPWTRKSSAYGYSQAKTGTWKDYRKETGNYWADRDDFSDAIDFMGWFIAKTHSINKVSKWDARKQYFNYHEGWGGYRKGSHKRKKWLLGVADKVNTRSSRYGAQYRKCKEDLEAGWFKGWFF